ncbi:MAG: 1-deoxy-D-xylulose-5-phosphate reductoisomerase [Clostridia bacterium]|nr:1-deoxy-D-xylulose-5-phosphate reductoisomerase [Clostridia bacterium]
MKNKICVLGSTGSIGTQTLEVARKFKTKITALAANKNITLLENQIREFKPFFAAVYDENLAKKLKEKVKDTNTKILSGIEGLCEVASLSSTEIVVTAVSGMIGLRPTLCAINTKKDIALANKETLVVGGDLVLNEAKKNGVNILPVDSEHSAIFQCLQSCKDKKDLKKLILTASGGPFFGKTKDELKNVTIKDALNHPNWKMGAKITIDSATMMNKGLEIIEAMHLFDTSLDKIDVIVHPQSIIHSMVEYVDGCILAQMGIPSMKAPIAYALTYPHRKNSGVKPLDFTKYPSLSFHKPDNETFEAMKICRKAASLGGTATTILNAANEEAVNLFLKEKIKFLEITELVKKALESFKINKISSLEDILETDKKTREFISKQI